MTSAAYLETSKHLRWSFLRQQFMADAVNWFKKKTPPQKIVDSNYTSILRQLNNFKDTECSWTIRVGLSCLICSASASFLLNSLFLYPLDRISKWSTFTFSWPVFSACWNKCDIWSRPQWFVMRSENLLPVSPLYVSSQLRSGHWAL